jgi:hypothetical protein
VLDEQLALLGTNVDRAVDDTHDGDMARRRGAVELTFLRSAGGGTGAGEGT